MPRTPKTDTIPYEGLWTMANTNVAVWGKITEKLTQPNSVHVVVNLLSGLVRFHPRGWWPRFFNIHNLAPFGTAEILDREISPTSHPWIFGEDAWLSVQSELQHIWLPDPACDECRSFIQEEWLRRHR
jgi:hypothetical protein